MSGYPPPQQGGWGAPPPQQGGWGTPPPQQQGGWGAPPPQQGGWGAPPPQQGGWGAPPPQQGGWGAPPQGGWGAPPPQQGWGAPPPQQGWGAPPPQQGWGAPPPQQGFGAPVPQGYGRDQGFAPPQQGGFGAPSGLGVGGPPQGLGVGGGQSTTTTITTIQTGASGLHFFNHVNNHLQRDYILIIDKSGSMAGSNWREAERAVSALAPSITKCDPDGITLYFFSSRGNYPKYANVTTPSAVENAFRSQSPSGTTCLDGVLQTAFDEHFRNNRPTTILIITDGEPDDRHAVERVIKDAANRLNRDEDLSVSFIQIGHDSAATRWLKKLDDELAGAKFDIVDAETAENMKGMDFASFIGKSIRD